MHPPVITYATCIVSTYLICTTCICMHACKDGGIIVETPPPHIPFGITFVQQQSIDGLFNIMEAPIGIK